MLKISEFIEQNEDILKLLEKYWLPPIISIDPKAPAFVNRFQEFSVLSCFIVTPIFIGILYSKCIS